MGKFRSQLAEFVVPVFAETLDEGFAKELIERYAEFTPFDDGVATDVPTAVVESDGSVGEALFPYGIK